MYAFYDFSRCFICFTTNLKAKILSTRTNNTYFQKKNVYKSHGITFKDVRMMNRLQ